MAFFETAYFSSSDSFEISGGTTASVSVTLTPTAISVIEDNASSNHATTVATPNLDYISGADLNQSSSNADPAPPTVPTQWIQTTWEVAKEINLVQKFTVFLILGVESGSTRIRGF